MVGLELPNLSSIGLGCIGIKVLRKIRNQNPVLQNGPSHIHILGKYSGFCGIYGPAPEDDGIGTNIEAKDAPALIRFKCSGRLYVVSHVVSERML